MNQNGHPPSSNPLVKVNIHGAAGTIILNRPDKRNAAFAWALLTDSVRRRLPICTRNGACGRSS